MVGSWGGGKNSLTSWLLKQFTDDKVVPLTQCLTALDTSESPAHTLADNTHSPWVATTIDRQTWYL